MRKINNLDVWRQFVAIVDYDGLNIAATKLKVEASSLSRSMHALESEIGAALWDRSTRPAKLTVLGEQVYEKAKVLLAEQESLENFLFDDKNAMSGSIRLASQVGLGAKVLTQHVVNFLKIYPDLHFQIFDQFDDIETVLHSRGNKRVDLVLGYSAKEDMPGIKKIYCGCVPFVACASREYIAERGAPESPLDCINHRGILVSSEVRNSINLLTKGNVSLPLSWKSTIVVGNPFAARRLLKLGAGIMPDMSLYHAEPYLQNGDWQVVMPGWHRPLLDTYVYVPEENYSKKRIRIFVEWLAEQSRKSLNDLQARCPEFYVL